MLFVRLGAVMQDVGRDDVRMQGETYASQAQAADLLDHHGAVEKIRGHATVLFRDMRAEHSRLPRLVPQRTVDMPILFPLMMERHGFLLKELAHAVAKLFVFGAENRSRDHGNTCLIERF